ncbi:MAG: hypothetical protein ORN26_00660, partial [Candidatus Pacebacteria bacterium]|nr:hypothetical protein [Candidatus Paceibacterota bacterium]
FTGGCPNNVCRGYELANNISFFPADVSISSIVNNWTQTNQRTGFFNSFIATGTDLIAGSRNGIYKSTDGGNT